MTRESFPARDPDPRDPSPTDPAELELLESLARWMDRRYLDPILGLLLPGVGDVLGSLVGMLSVGVAFRLRAHPVVIARMLLNLAIDVLIGAVPLLGDAADIFYRAHSRNLALLRSRHGRRARASDWLFVAAAALLFLIALSLPIALLVVAVRSL